MLILLYLVFLCSNFLFIKCDDNENVTIDVNIGVNCTSSRSGYTFTDGQNINLVITPHMHINHGLWDLISENGSKKLYSELKTIKKHEDNTPFEPILHSSSVDKSMEGTWQFKFYYYKGNSNFDRVRNLPKVQYADGYYYESVCRLNVIIVPKPTAAPEILTPSDKKLLIISCVVGTILSGIIIAQAVYIVILKAKARKLITLNTHNNLSKKTEAIPNDTARYCSNPGQKIMKVPEEDDDRGSAIYEAPNIEISGNARMPMQPPLPPAITTMPRTPRPDHNMKIGPQAMLASALHSPARSPMSDNLPPNFQRSKLERETSLANRPPLPLPTHGHPTQGHPHQGHPNQGHPHNNTVQEDYEDVGTADDTYEQPPVPSTLPPRLPMPPKKVPTGNLLDVKENTLKMRQGNKPVIIPKPQQSLSNNMATNELQQALRRRNNDSIPKTYPHMPPKPQEQIIGRRPNGDSQTNELEEALRRRNNVKQVPIVSIPDPSSRASPKPKPPPALKCKPRGPPVQQPVPEEVFYNENEASSDEEWTYEPLKHLHSYDPNIYNV